MTSASLDERIENWKQVLKENPDAVFVIEEISVLILAKRGLAAYDLQRDIENAMKKFLNETQE